MLVLTRRVNERISIGHGVILTVARVGKTKIRLAIEAPTGVIVHREEIADRLPSPCTPVPPETGNGEP